jgi:peroxiredoxin
LREEQTKQLVLSDGDEAPDFTLKDQNGQPVTLSNFRGVRNVLLVFFPLAFTGICQGELDEIRDHLPDYENNDTAALAISVGPPPTHKIWAIQSGFIFPVLSDFWPHGAARPTACSTTTPVSPTAAPSWWIAAASSGSPR